MTGIVPELFDQTPWNGTLDQIRLPARLTPRGSSAAAVGTALAAHGYHSLPNAGPSHINAISVALSTFVLVQQMQSLFAEILPFLASRPSAAIEPAHANAAELAVVPELVGQRPALSVQHRFAKVGHAFLGGHDIIPLDECILVVQLRI
jgi:hypothetical protein